MNVHDYDIKTDSKRLKMIRKRAKLTQEEAASQMGINRWTYQSKESGESVFKDSEKLMMQHLYNMSFEEFDEVLYGGSVVQNFDVFFLTGGF